MKTQNIPQVIYDLLLLSKMEVRCGRTSKCKGDCGRLFLKIDDYEIHIVFSGENNQNISLLFCFPALSSDALVEFAYNACLIINPSLYLAKIKVLPISDTEEALFAVVDYTCFTNQDAVDFITEGLNAIICAKMMVSEFYMSNRQ